MGFIRKILDTLSRKNDKPKITVQFSDSSDHHDSHKKLTISDIHEKINKANKLADIANKTADKDEFDNSIEEIEKILSELIKYESKYDFYYPPSADLVNLRNGKAEQIELLKKRIAEKENIQSLTEDGGYSEPPTMTKTIKIPSTTELVDCAEQSEKDKDTVAQNKENTQNINTDNQPQKKISLLTRKY